MVPSLIYHLASWRRTNCFHNAEAGALYSVGWNAYGQCGTGDWYVTL